MQIRPLLCEHLNKTDTLMNCQKIIYVEYNLPVKLCLQFTCRCHVCMMLIDK